MLDREDVQDQFIRALLEILLRNRDPRAADKALEWIKTGCTNPKRAVIAAEEIVLHGDGQTLDKLLEVLEPNKTLMEEVFQSVAGRDDARRVTRQQLPVATRLELYRLMVGLFPPSEDAVWRVGTAHRSTPRDLAGEMRDRQLREIGTTESWESLDAIENIACAYPDLAHPRRVRTKVEESILRSKWTPLDHPQSVLAVVVDDHQRILRTADQLLDLTLEALSRLQSELTLGAVADLWSQWTVEGKWRYRPKRELLVVDYVKRYLDRDLKSYTIVGNREVENRLGNETDILVQYVDRDTAGTPLSVVIEAKGKWHDDVLTSIETQLALRYLIDYETNRGIYLVVWFGCPRWDEDDSEHSQLSTFTARSLQEKLNGKARRLSVNGRRIEAFVLDASWPWPNVPREESERSEEVN